MADEAEDLKTDFLIVFRRARSQRIKAGTMVDPKGGGGGITTKCELKNPQ